MPGAGGEPKMPEGHPPMPGRGGMPPGHPAVGGGGVRREGQAGAAEVSPAKDLKPGEVRVRVLRGKARAPLAGALVFVDGQRPSGELRTGADGSLLLTVPASAASQPASQPASAPASQPAAARGPISVTVRHDGFSYRSAPVELPAEGGLTLTFPVYDRSKDTSRLVIGQGSQLIFQISEGSLAVTLDLQLTNRGDTLFDPGSAGLAIPLPARATEVVIPDALKPILKHQSEQHRLLITKPLPPGLTPLRFAVELPYRGGEVEYRQQLPLALEPSLAGVINGPGVELQGPAIDHLEPPPEGEKDGQPRPRVYVLAKAAAGASLELTLSGLPHRDERASLVAIALAAVLLLWGVAAAVVGPRRARERQTRREALLQQLVQLARSKHRGEQVTQKRKELLQELRQQWEEPW